MEGAAGRVKGGTGAGSAKGRCERSRGGMEHSWVNRVSTAAGRRAVPGGCWAHWGTTLQVTYMPNRMLYT